MEQENTSQFMSYNDRRNEVYDTTYQAFLHALERFFTKFAKAIYAAKEEKDGSSRRSGSEEK